MAFYWVVGRKFLLIILFLPKGEYDDVIQLFKAYNNYCHNNHISDGLCRYRDRGRA